MREHAAHPAPALPVLLKFKSRSHQVARHTGGSFDLVPGAGIKFFSVPLVELGLVIKGIHLADAPIHEQLDDAPDFGAMMEAALEFRARFQHRRVRQQFVASQQMGQSDATESTTETPKEFFGLRIRLL